jgi:hypothetical protein
VTNLDIVLDYAKRGWQVFPLVPGTKLPLARSNGFHDATSNPAALRRWFSQGHPYNIGIRTGIASGVFVLDVDGDIGAESLHALEAEHSLLPDTLTSTTGKGRHLWFRAEGEIPCSNDGKVSAHLDIKGDGGYVVAPPSIHPNGTAYRWANDLPPAVAPRWLIDLARRRPKPPAIPHSSPRPTTARISTARSSAAYGHSALEGEIEALSNTAPGNRNHALNRASFCLHQLVAGSELDGAEVERGLWEGAKANGLLADDGPNKIRCTIESGREGGLRQPRDRHGRR